MEEVSYLFNADFEDKLINGKLTQYESSKLNQEFEYLIYWSDPLQTIFTTKIYDLNYLEHINTFTKKELKTTSVGKVKLYCQDFEQLELVKKLSNKFETAKFLISQDLNSYPLIFRKEINQLKEGFLYKSPSGVSGSGHFLFPTDQVKILKVLKFHSEILEEPIQVRERDFSTLIENNKLVSTYENYVDERFQYKGSYFSPEFTLGHKHDDEYKKAISLIIDYTKDYNGIMSIDGFSYNDGKKIQSCCEINPRKTMGHAAYLIWQKYFMKNTHFKFLLFKNTYSKVKIESEFYKREDCSLLLSPSSNRFLIFTIAGNSDKDILEREKQLSATLLKCF